ncbi:MBL fold metallo-hydrolase [candidate division WWE3 bacterium]|uniref:MBL fold metallo-hydrolase n=1 Tax=candidate division WWE3 bacterium TaxID=2053526 RepID=A0A3A4ZBL8_UNCKA|nr:MAG: MBL fold metallo-hydrolase [candidate division WWE3 bacterium]
MRRWALSVCLTLFLVLVLALPAMAAPKVFVDGTALTYQVPPRMEQGTTLVPLRGIFESLGATVVWDGATQTVKASKGSTQIQLKIGSTTAYRNGQAVTLAVPGKVINGSTLVPLRFVSEALGADVKWDGPSQTITITSTVSTPSGSITTKIHFIDVSQGDAIYIELPNNVDILIDAGDVGYGDTVVNYLKSRNVDDIEILIATHPHADHIGGLPAVFAAYDVELVVDSGVDHTTQAFTRYDSGVKSAGGTYQKAANQSWIFGSCKFEVLGPTKTYSDLNNASVITKLTCPGASFIFTGDAEADGEGAILHKNLDATILKVGHHGSRTSTTDAFLARVSPEVAVIMVGVDNRYGHPHAETLAKLGAAGITIYRTDLHGSVVISLTNAGYSVTTQRSVAQPTVQPAPVQPSPSSDTTGSKINLNTASLDELQLITHIGLARAEEIIRLRPFRSLDDLSRVSGIGPSRLADIKAQGVAYVQD